MHRNKGEGCMYCTLSLPTPHMTTSSPIVSLLKRHRSLSSDTLDHITVRIGKICDIAFTGQVEHLESDMYLIRRTLVLLYQTK